MKALKNTLMQLAVAILLLHSIVPHHHHSESPDLTSCLAETTQQPDDLLDVLGELFHTDLGSDHLEKWVKSQSGSIFADIIAVTVTPFEADVALLPLTEPEVFRVPRNTSWHPNFLISSSPHRGPPANILA